MTVRPKLFRRGGVAAVLVAAMLSFGCGEFARQSHSPSQLVIVSLGTQVVEDIVIEGGTGVPGRVASIDTFAPGPLDSNVNSPMRDVGQVVLGLILRDPGTPPDGIVTPTPLNDVTVTEYEVRYRLLDGRNTPGVDVPHPIRGGLTFTVQGARTGTGIFDLVRIVAKNEQPLAALQVSAVVLTVIADVTFYGRDQAGNAVSATGSVQINFANFG